MCVCAIKRFIPKGWELNKPSLEENREKLMFVMSRAQAY